MSPKQSNSQDGLSSSTANRTTLAPLQPLYDDHPLDDRYLQVSAEGNLDECESEALPSTQPPARSAQTRHGRTRSQPKNDKDGNISREMLLAENHELRQQAMGLKLQLADALAKIDELVQQNRQLHNMMNEKEAAAQDGSTRKPNKADACNESRQETKPVQIMADDADGVDQGNSLRRFDRSLGYGHSNTRPSSYLSRSGGGGGGANYGGAGIGPLQALGGASTVLNMFTSLRGEAEVTNTSVVASKRSSLVSSRSSFYSARSMSSVSVSVRNDDSSQSISLHPDDLARYGGDNSIPSIGHHHHNSGTVLESTPEERAVSAHRKEMRAQDNTTTGPSLLQKLASLPVLNRGESAGSTPLDDNGSDIPTNNIPTNNLRQMSRRGSNSAPNLHSLAPTSGGAPADPEQERQKLAQNISPSTLRQFHGSMLDLMAMAPSKLAEVTREDEVAAEHVPTSHMSEPNSQVRSSRIHRSKPLNSGDQFEVPLKAEKTKAAEEEDAGMKRNNTDKDVNDFFRRMSGAMSDDESDTEDLAGGGNEEWDDLADKPKKLSSISKDSVQNDFSAMADKLIADSTFDLYK